MLEVYLIIGAVLAGLVLAWITVPLAVIRVYWVLWQAVQQIKKAHR